MSELQPQPSARDETMAYEEQLTTQTVTFWQRVTLFLFEPHFGITEVGARQQARLVSIITLFFAIVITNGTLAVFFITISSTGRVVLPILTAVAIIGYVLSRTRYYQVGGGIIILALTLAAFASSGDPNNLSNSLYSNLIPALIIASIIFPFRYMILFSILINIAIGLTPIVYPEHTNVGIDLGIFISFTILTLVAMRYREIVERDRLAELQKTNRKITTLSNELEQRVAERTTALEIANEQVERRAEQFEAIAQVSRIISSIQDQEELLPRITHMISRHFGFYHVGVFLLDENNQFAVLRAANSEGGQRMLARRHSLEVGQTGIVGYVTATGNPRVALDTGSDAVYFDNPDLPETHSEMALPLKAGGRVVGALDVQSTEPNAFTQEDVNILSALADQVSSAIQNTRLYDESREALAQAEAVSRQLTGQAWTNIQRFTPLVGYHFDGTKPEPITQPTNDEQAGTQKDAYSVPVQLRGESIGRLRIKPAADGHQWTGDEIAIIRATAERVALAAENARLILESQKNAAKEQVIGEISSKIGAAINLDNILQTTLREMGRILPGAEISIQVENE